MKPIPTDCCGTGCAKCIYEIYDEQLEKYEKWKKAQTSSETKGSNENR